MSDILRCVFIAAALAAVAACGAEPSTDTSDPSCSGGKCDAVQTACDGAFVDLSAAGLDSPGPLTDDFATRALREGECPTTLADVMERLLVDAPRDHGQVVNEVAATLDEAVGTYRAVVAATYDDDGRSAYVRADALILGDQGPIEELEVIAYDPAFGTFNFYELGDGTWRFHGSSDDFDSAYSAAVGVDAHAAETRGMGSCGSCHVNGGPVMREIHEPHVNWSGFGHLRGSGELFEAHPELGWDGSGVSLGGDVKFSLIALNRSRAATMIAEGRARALLRPLFCDDEFNIISADESSLSTDLSLGEGHFMHDELVPVTGKAFYTMTIERSDYGASRADARTRALDDEGEEIADDMAKALVDIGRGFSDRAMVRTITAGQKLNEALGVAAIDANFRDAVFSIDFTRAVFSDERCELLRFVPVTMGEINPEAVRNEVVKAIEAEAPAPGTPAADLLERLNAGPDADLGLGPQVSSYLTACEARPPRDLLADLITVASVRRARAAEHALIDSPAILPRTDPQRSADRDLRLHPETCTLTSSYLSTVVP